MKTAKNYFVIGFFLLEALSAPLLFGQSPTSTSVPSKSPLGNDRYPLPKEGLVPDKETAIKIAEVVLFRLYGEDSIKSQRPYAVKEADYIWWISGTLPKDNFGSVFNIGISQHMASGS